MRIDFKEIKRTASKSGKCVVCGRSCQRTETFFQTVNPFNKNKNGTMKTERAISAELFASADSWIKEPIKHAKCE